MIAARRAGAALILAILAIIVLDCIVLGMLNLALQEQRIGSNRSVILQLRLDADGGIRRALASWTPAIDTMPIGSAARMHFPPARTAGALVSVERLDAHLFILESLASETPPRFGRASARLLVRPPALPPAIDPAPAPASSSGPVQVRATGAVSAVAPAQCAATASPYSILAPPFSITLEPGASVDAPTGLPPQPALVSEFTRLEALALPPFTAEGDSTITADAAGLLIVDGNVRISGSAVFTGLLVASGSVTIDQEAAVYGAIHAAAGLSVAGRIGWDPCAVAAAVDESGSSRPHQAGNRAWLPGF